MKKRIQQLAGLNEEASNSMTYHRTRKSIDSAIAYIQLMLKKWDSDQDREIASDDSAYPSVMKKVQNQLEKVMDELENRIG